MPHQDNLFCCIFWRKVYLAVDPSATSPLIRQALHRNAFGGPTSIPKLITFHKRITKWIIKERLENCFSLSSILHAFQITQTWLLLNAILGRNHCNAFRCKWGQYYFFCFLISNPRTEKFTHILVEHKVFFFAKPENFLFSSLRRCPKMCLWFARLRRENSIEYPARHVCHVLLWLLCLRHRLQETNHDYYHFSKDQQHQLLSSKCATLLPHL